MQNSSQALMGAAPTGHAVNPSVFINLQESLKLRSIPLMAGSFLDIFRYGGADAEQSWFSKPVLGSVLALVATLLVVEQVSNRMLCVAHHRMLITFHNIGRLPKQKGSSAWSEMDYPGYRQIRRFHEP
jgi:hypothetical protein